MPASGDGSPETDRSTEEGDAGRGMAMEVASATQGAGEEPGPPDPLLAELPDSQEQQQSEETDTEVDPASPALPNVSVKRPTSLKRLVTTDFWLKPPDPDIDAISWIFYVLSIVFPLVGFVINVNQLVNYSREGHWYYFGILCTSMVVPYLLTNVLSHFWRANDCDERDELMPRYESKFSLVAGFMFLTKDTGEYAWRIARHKEFKHYHDAFQRQADMAHIQLIYTFLASGPQLVLKVYRLMNEEWGGSTRGGDVFFAILTALSLANSIRTASLNSRRVRYDKRNICYAGTAIQVLYTLGFLSSRVMALACLFSTNRIAGLVVCLFIIMGCWLWMTFVKSARTEVMKTKGREYFYRATMSFAQLFCYINIPDTPALKRYAIYYVISFLFDLVCLSIFCYIKESWWPVTFLISFVLGIGFHLLNHTQFHQNSGRLYRPREQQDWERQCPHCRRQRESDAGTHAPAEAIPEATIP